MTRSTRDFWVNQGLFQLAWPACVLGAAWGTLWPAALLVSTMLAWQLHPAHRHPNDLLALAAFVAAGLVLDTFWMQAGVVDYALAAPFEGFQPGWLTGLWIALGLTANHSLSVFRHRWRLWVLLASIGSPLSYTMAARAGAVEWTAPTWVVVLCIGPVWAVVTGMLFRALPGGEGEAEAEAEARTESKSESKSESDGVASQQRRDQSSVSNVMNLERARG